MKPSEIEANLPPSILVVIPKQPFYDWLASLPGVDQAEISLLKEPGQQTCWLLPSPDFFPSKEAFAGFLNTIKPAILAYELESWTHDPVDWPGELNAELFEHWFDTVFYSSSIPFTELLDLEEETEDSQKEGEQ